MKTLIEKLILEEKITNKEIQNELYEICDREHSNCNEDCPVYKLNGNEPPSEGIEENETEGNYGCDCFKNGKLMFEFIKKHS